MKNRGGSKKSKAPKGKIYYQGEWRKVISDIPGKEDIIISVDGASVAVKRSEYLPTSAGSRGGRRF